MIKECTNCGKQYETLSTTIIKAEGNLMGWRGCFCSTRCREVYQRNHPEKFKMPYWVETVVHLEEVFGK